MVRILIADDHEVVRSGIRNVLESEPNWEVVAEAGDGNEAISQALETKPDIAVLDYAMPVINGAEATRQIRTRLPKTEVLIFTVYDNEVVIRELLRAGARGYVLKSDCKGQLVEAVEALAVHKPFFTAEVSSALLDCYLTRPGPERPTLTERERSVVQLIAEGHTNGRIAQFLNTTLKAVEMQRAAIKREIGCSSSAAIVRYAIRNGLVEP